MNRLPWLAIVWSLLAASSAGAQSLADIAKQEEARRQAIKAPSKVLTNDDLKPYRTTPPPATEQKPQAPAAPPASGKDAGAAAKDAAAAGAQAKADKPAADQEPAKDEAWWRKRMMDALAALDRSKVLADALQSRANALLTDFTARDDPAQRAALANERVRVLAELDKMKAEIEANTKAIAAIEDEARQAGVPPGWLRPSVS